MTNQCVVFFTDNAALVDILNKQSSKHATVMTFLRAFCRRVGRKFKGSSEFGTETGLSQIISAGMSSFPRFRSPFLSVFKPSISIKPQQGGPLYLLFIGSPIGAVNYHIVYFRHQLCPQIKRFSRPYDFIPYSKTINRSEPPSSE